MQPIDQGVLPIRVIARAPSRLDHTELAVEAEGGEVRRSHFERQRRRPPITGQQGQFAAQTLGQPMTLPFGMDPEVEHMSGVGRKHDAPEADESALGFGDQPMARCRRQIQLTDKQCSRPRVGIDGGFDGGDHIEVGGFELAGDDHRGVCRVLTLTFTSGSRR